MRWGVRYADVKVCRAGDRRTRDGVREIDGYIKMVSDIHINKGC